MKVYTANINSNSGFISNFSGRSHSKAVCLVNELGEYGFLKGEDKPYFPVGGRSALVDVYKVGAITFKHYSFGDGFDVKRGRQVK